MSKSLCMQVVLGTLSKLGPQINCTTVELLRKSPKRTLKTKSKKPGSSEDNLEFQTFKDFPMSKKYFEDTLRVVENLAGNDVASAIDAVLKWAPLSCTEYSGMRTNGFDQKYTNALFSAHISTKGEEESQWNFWHYMIDVVKQLGTAEGTNWEILECIMDVIFADLVHHILCNYTGNELRIEQLTNIQNIAIQYFRPRASQRLQDPLWDRYREYVNTTWSKIMGILSNFHFDDVFQKFMARVAFVLDPVPPEEAAAYFKGMRHLTLPPGNTEEEIKNIHDYLSQHVALAETYKYSIVKSAQATCLLHTVSQIKMGNTSDGSMNHVNSKVETMYMKLLEWSVKHEDLHHVFFPTLAAILARSTDRFFGNYADIFFKKFLFKNMVKQKDKDGHLAAVLFHLRGKFAPKDPEKVGVSDWRVLGAPDHFMWEGDPMKAVRKGCDVSAYKYRMRDTEKKATADQRLKTIIEEIFPRKPYPKFTANITALVDIIVHMSLHNLELMIDTFFPLIFNKDHRVLEYYYAGVAACRVILTPSSGFQSNFEDETLIEKMKEALPKWMLSLLEMCEAAVGIGLEGVSPNYLRVTTMHTADIPTTPLSEPEIKWSVMVSVYREIIRCIPLFPSSVPVPYTPIGRALIHVDVDLAISASQVLQNTVSLRPDLVCELARGILAVQQNPRICFTAAQLTLLEHVKVFFRIAMESKAEYQPDDDFWRVIYETEAAALIALSSTSASHRRKAFAILQTVDEFCEAMIPDDNRAQAEPRVYSVVKAKGPEIIMTAVRITQSIFIPVSHRDPDMEPAPAVTSLRDVAALSDEWVMDKLWPQCLAGLVQRCVDHGCTSAMKAGRFMLVPLIEILPPLEGMHKDDLDEMIQQWASTYSLFVGMSSIPTPKTSLLPFDTVQTLRETEFPTILNKLLAVINGLWNRFSCDIEAYMELTKLCLSSLGSDCIGPVTNSFIGWFFATLKKTKKQNVGKLMQDSIRLMRVISQNPDFSKSLVDEASIKTVLMFWYKISTQMADVTMNNFADVHLSIDYTWLVYGIVMAIRHHFDECPDDKRLWNSRDRKKAVMNLFLLMAPGDHELEQIAMRKVLAMDESALTSYDALMNDLHLAIRLAVTKIISVGPFIEADEELNQEYMAWFLEAEKADHRVFRWILQYNSDLLPRFARGSYAGWKPNSPNYFFDAICDQILPSYSSKFSRSSGMGRTMEFILQSAALDDGANEEPDETANALMGKYTGELLLLSIFNLSSSSAATRLRSFWMLLWLAGHLGLDDPSELQESLLSHESHVLGSDTVAQKKAISEIIDGIAHDAHVSELVISMAMSIFDVFPSSEHGHVFNIITPFFASINLSTVADTRTSALAKTGNKQFLDQLFAATIMSVSTQSIPMWTRLACAVQPRNQDDLPPNAHVILEFLLQLGHRAEYDQAAAKIIGFALFKSHPMQVMKQLSREFGMAVKSEKKEEEKKRNVARMFPGLLQAERRIHRDSMAASLEIRPAFKDLVPAETAPAPEAPPASTKIPGQSVSADAFKIPDQESRKVPESLKIHDFEADSRPVVERQHAAISLLADMVGSNLVSDYTCLAAMIHFAIVNFNIESGTKSSSIRLLLLHLMNKAKESVPEALMMKLERLIAWLRSPSFLLFWGKQNEVYVRGDPCPYNSISAMEFAESIVEIMTLEDPNFNDYMLASCVQTVSMPAIEDESIFVHNQVIFQALMKTTVDKRAIDAQLKALVVAVGAIEACEMESIPMLSHRIKCMVATLKRMAELLGKDSINHSRFFWSCIVLLRLGLIERKDNVWGLYNGISDLLITLLSPDGMSEAVAHCPTAQQFSQLAPTWSPQFTGMQSMLMQVLTSDVTPSDSMKPTMRLMGLSLWFTGPIRSIGHTNDDSWDIQLLASLLPWIHDEISRGRDAMWPFFRDIAAAIKGRGTVDPSALLREWKRDEADDFVVAICKGMVPSFVANPQRSSEFAAVWNRQWNFGNLEHQHALILAARALVEASEAHAFVDPNFAPIISTCVAQLSVPKLRSVAFDVVRAADTAGKFAGSIQMQAGDSMPLSPTSSTFGNAHGALESLKTIE